MGEAIRTRADSLSPRAYDSNGRLQMAESRLDQHGEHDTALEDLFIVHHYDRPNISDGHRLTITGPNGESHDFGLGELQSLPVREAAAVLECAGNGRGFRKHRTPGNQFGLGLFGQARWSGVSLAEVLAYCSLTDGWTTAEAHAPDGGVTMPEGVEASFCKGLPRAKALQPGTMLAWGVNGEPLPAEHGGPLRLVVPGWYGIWWVKWVERIELTDDEFRGFWQNERYTYQDPDGHVLGLVAEQAPRAVITEPVDGSPMSDGDRLRGLAWAGEESVEQVEITFDDGATWLATSISDGGGEHQWVRWEADLPAGIPRGMRRAAVRASNASGWTQPWESPDDRLGYGNSGVHQITIDLVARPPQTA